MEKRHLRSSALRHHWATGAAATGKERRDPAVYRGGDSRWGAKTTNFIESVVARTRRRFVKENGVPTKRCDDIAIAELREHSYRTSIYAARFALAAMDRMRSIEEAQALKFLPASALLHDIGKVAIPSVVLAKGSRLDGSEFAVIRKHPEWGGYIIDESTLPAQRSEELIYQCWQVAMFHHERWDGSGYPYGLAGEDIPFAARVVAILDVYDALAHRRSYKRAHSHGTAVDIIRSSQAGQFDPRLVPVFLEVADALPSFAG
jgi:HD-GYP domain-containing protein (c-di-GMP phosphodiesterase class II)